MEKRVLELVTSHGTLVSPEVVNYISSKNDPEKYIHEIMKHFPEVPLFLTVDLLKGAEAAMVPGDNGDKKEINIIRSQIENHVENMVESQEENQKEESEKLLMEPSSVNVEKITQPQEPEPSIIQSQEQPIELETAQQKSPPLIKSQALGGTKKILAKEYESDVKILKDVTGHSTTEGTLKDFTKYFQERFRKLRKLLQIQRREVIGSIDIAKARNHQGPIKIIGLINSVRTTKQGHKIIELEDETDTISALINNTSPLITMTFVNDEVICLIGKLGKTDLIYVEDVIRPDIPIARKQNRSEDPLCCLFMADIHIGSTTFLHDSWNKLINWLNGKYSLNGADALREKLKYIVVSGDAVDGIGIYPNQESELEITDIYAQYETLAKKFEDIPSHINIILQPGNHDAVRLAEPQPAFPEEIVSLFSNEIEFVGNPCYFTLNGVEVLSYHGCSMDDFVMQIPEVTYNAPIKIMKEMLVRRHLAPIYGDKTPIAPEHQDYMVIDRIPDIFVTGHIHKTAVENYRDIVLINASAWQAQTDYQKMRNFNPEPGNAILSDLQTGALKILNFK